MAEDRTCTICGRNFTPGPVSSPAEEAGALLAAEQYGDAGALCRDCLTSRGILTMMYGPEGSDG